jgi:hypothetical protein
MPSGQSVKGTHAALDPTPAASLAPTAVYTMDEPAGGGPLGADGELVFDSWLHATAVATTPTASSAIRKIGERPFTREKVAPKSSQGSGDRH